MQKKDLGVKAAEYIIRNMKQEFDYDASKGEWGAHHAYFKQPQFFKSSVEEAVEFDFAGYSQVIILFYLSKKNMLKKGGA